MAEPAQNPITPVIPMTPGRQPPTSFSARIIFFVFLSTFLTAATVSTLAIESMRRGIRDQVDLRLTSVLDRRADSIEARLQAGRDEFRRALRRYDPAMVDAAALGQILPLLPHFTAIGLVDSDGGLVHAAGPMPDLEWPDVDTDTPAVRWLALPSGRAGEVGVELLARMATPGNPSAPAVVGLYDLSALADLLTLEPHEGEGHVLIADERGLLVQQAPAAARTNADVRSMAEWLLESGESRARRFIDASGNHGIGDARSLSLPGWSLIVETSFAHAYAPMMSVVERIILCDLLIILLFTFLSYRVSSALMSPIESLSKAAAAMSQGDELREIPMPHTSDEIGLLTSCFNDMVSRLRQNRLEIEHDKRALTAQNDELQRANEVLAQLSITDGLTKLHNHRYFQDHLTREIKRLSRTDQPLSIILIDLDDFKQLNDKHGHAAGDEVLTSVATLMNNTVRESDLLARYGGEEFVILTPGTSLEGAIALAEKIRMTVEQTPQIFDDSRHAVRVTLSCGVAQYRGNRKRFFQAADRALYAAKAEGKNCVVADSQD